MISEKDLNAIAEIIKGNLTDTRWLRLLVNSLADYFKREYDIDMTSFKKKCLNGDSPPPIIDKEETTPIISKVEKSNTLSSPAPSISHHLQEADEAIRRWPELLNQGQSQE
tara:strand:+ start:2997 stop:3329 length:333 start_codon:yes stop_codon:yes gene_type:complete